jgi:hypothetical protein
VHKFNLTVLTTAVFCDVLRSVNTHAILKNCTQQNVKSGECGGQWSGHLWPMHVLGEKGLNIVMECVQGERGVLCCRHDTSATRVNEFQPPVWFSYPSWQSHVHLFPSSCSSVTNIFRGTPGNSPVFGFSNDCSELLRTSILRFRTQVVCSKSDLGNVFTLVLRRVKCRMGLRTPWNTCTTRVTSLYLPASLTVRTVCRQRRDKMERCWCACAYLLQPRHILWTS